MFKKAKYKCRLDKHIHSDLINRVPIGNDGVDFDVQLKLLDRGICSGIAATWVVAFLCGNEGAWKPDKFVDYYLDVLRFQGAYLKFVHTTGPEDIDRLALAMGIRDVKLHSEDLGVTSWRQVYTTSISWAAYISLFHSHAVGIGWLQDYDLYAIMDPNEGLFLYDDYEKFIADLQELTDSERQLAGTYGLKYPVKVWIYT